MASPEDSVFERPEQMSAPTPNLDATQEPRSQGYTDIQSRMIAALTGVKPEDVVNAKPPVEMKPPTYRPGVRHG